MLIIGCDYHPGFQQIAWVDKHYRKGGPYDIVVTGYRHRGLNGVDLALAIRRLNPAQRIVVITESSVVVRSIQRKLRDIPVIEIKKLIKALLQMGRAKIAADRAKESSLPSSIQKRIQERRKRNPSAPPDLLSMAFLELQRKGAPSLLNVLHTA